MMKDSAFDNFNESALQVLDFARCQRPDGSYYGTSGQCRKGAPADPKEKEAKAKSAPAGLGEMTIKTQADMKKMSDGELKSHMKLANKVAFQNDVLKLTKAQFNGLADQHKMAKTELDSRSGDAQTAGKIARKEMIAARSKEQELRAARRTAEAGGNKKAAAAARRAHIDSKKEVKAATEKFRSGQAKGGDNRRFGRENERSSATNAQLQSALKDKRVSPRAKAAIERELSARQARTKRDPSKDLKNRRGQVIGTSPRNMKIDTRKELIGKADAFKKEGRPVPQFLKDAITNIDRDLASGS